MKADLGQNPVLILLVKRPAYPLTKFEDRFVLYACYFFKLQYVWFSVHLYPG